MLKYAMCLLVAVGAAACGGPGDDDPSPFASGACDSAWRPVAHQELTSCDHECATVPPNFGGSADSTLCYSSRPDSPDATCDSSFVDGNGLRGCCHVEHDEGAEAHELAAHYYECQ